jgi:flagellar motility protein MotE (MotC chaperone)
MCEILGELNVIQITYLMIVKFRERLAVGKQAAQRFDGQRFNLRKLNEPEVREQYQIEITNRFATLENLNDDVNRTWENIRENIQTSVKRVWVCVN